MKRNKIVFKEYMIIQRQEIDFYKKLIEFRDKNNLSNNEASYRWIELFAKKFEEEFEKEIKNHKWYESERAGCDIGLEKAVLDWIERFEQVFIDRWHDENYK